jgi:N-acetylglucosamine malate deacetylase 1
MNKVDILAMAAHPDDVELGCAGTLMKAVSEGKHVGICDLTRGELGTRGNAQLRLKEADKGRQIIGADFRVNMEMADGFFEISEENKLKLIQVIRACKPEVVLCNALSDRHPDHGRGAELQKLACFLSGLRKIETEFEGKIQEEWRPKVVLHYGQDVFHTPDILVDITAFWSKKMEAVNAFSSQFYNPESTEPMSSISSKQFLEVVEGRGKTFGRYMSVDYAEGFRTERPLGVSNVTELF